jgi:glutamyl-tRNA synthetase
MKTREQLAELIFPDVKQTVADLEKQFPVRPLPEGAKVTRFAPSPTGFLHTGSLFTAMIAQKVAHQSKGVFFIRLEDTDTKREISGSGDTLISQLREFGVIPDEGYLGNKEKGSYGPYKQSDRASIYKTVIKKMIIDGDAYPCFATPEELEHLRADQEKNKLIPGYYGPFAIYRNLPVDEAFARISRGDKFVMRFKSRGNHEQYIHIHDLIRGDLELSQNDQDIVILKGDGLPTYHFAHAVDDHLMRTNCVTRGEEWLSSLPIHLELFEVLGWPSPEYAHLPVIMKLDEGNKRKLSKRKDPEAAVSFFLDDGYPPAALIEYLMTIANSNFEEWRAQNIHSPREAFLFSFEKMSLDGALFDIMKLKFISREVLSRETAKRITYEARDYATKHDAKLYELITRDQDFFESIMNIEREKENPRKDYEKFSDILPLVRFFYREYYLQIIAEDLPFNPTFSRQVIAAVLEDIRETVTLEDVSEDEWFSGLKAIGEAHAFAPSGKIFKMNKEKYLGHIGDVAEMLRIAITGSKQSPNLYYVLKVLGIQEVKDRLAIIVEKLSK